MQTITLTKPDDWHAHVRDGNKLSRTVNDLAKQFRRAIIMPNLAKPVTSFAAALAYRERIMAALDSRYDFSPLMTLYLQEGLPLEPIVLAHNPPLVYGIKLYPQGATTNSAQGVQRLTSIYPLLETLELADIPLLVHGEVTDSDVDIFDREAFFIDRYLVPLVKKFPRLRVVLEHISTKEAVAFVQESSPQVAATITLHHLLLNRNDLLVNRVKPHHYCLPVLKRATHQRALITAALSGNPKFFFGSDSAPHSQSQKESACGCAGIYTAYAAVAGCVTFFEQHNALERVEPFMSHFGCQFYKLPRNIETITLRRQAMTIPYHLTFGDEQLIPFQAGETLPWTLVNE